MLRLLSLAVLLLPGVSLAAPRGCPPLGVIPGFVANDTRTRSYERQEFSKPVPGSDEGESVEVAGQTCVTYYSVPEGKEGLSVLEIQMNYRQQLEAMGAEIASSNGPNTYARLVKDGVTTWLRVYSSETTIEAYVLVEKPPTLTLLPPSGNDYRLVGHMPDFVARAPLVRNFDSSRFDTMDESGEHEVTAQGRKVVVYYALTEGKPEISLDEFRANYVAALRAQGAEILRDYGPIVTARMLNNGQVIWIEVSGGNSIEVTVIEEKPFQPSIQPPPMEQVRTTLEKAGRVTLYVNFDFDKATLRPDAAAVVSQVAAMLKANATLRLAVEGHTDGVGTAEHNRKLSAERAAAFMAALVAQGVAADRLTSAGFGPDKPVATNDTSEGRARNRRVELVRL